MTKAIQVHEEAALAAGSGGEIAGLLNLALEQKVPVETLERLVTLYERMADRKAEQDFSQALAEFQAECPSIPKTSKAKFPTANGGTMEYSYAELDTIAEVVGPLLHHRGMSYSWDSRVEAGTIHCTCKLRHANGHSVTASFECPTETNAKMNAQQKVAAGLTYARRQSLIQVLGLTTTDPDPDGGDGSNEKITEAQAADLSAMIEDVGASLPLFLKWGQVEKVSDLPARKHAAAVSMLNQKRKRGGK